MLPAIPSSKALAVVFSKKLPKYFHQQEIDQILDTVKDKPKQYLLIQLLWQTGARISELLELRVKDIDFIHRAARIVTLKQKRRYERSIPLQAGLIGLLGAYVAGKQLGRDDLVLNINRQRAHTIVKEAVKKAGLDSERAHPHTFRHSFAVFSVVSGVPILAIKKWLGHSNIQSTLVYMQILDSDTRHFYEGLRFG